MLQYIGNGAQMIRVGMGNKPGVHVTTLFLQEPIEGFPLGGIFIITAVDHDDFAGGGDNSIGHHLGVTAIGQLQQGAAAQAEVDLM